MAQRQALDEVDAVGASDDQLRRAPAEVEDQCLLEAQGALSAGPGGEGLLAPGEDTQVNTEGLGPSDQASGVSSLSHSGGGASLEGHAAQGAGFVEELREGSQGTLYSLVAQTSLVVEHTEAHRRSAHREGFESSIGEARDVEVERVAPDVDDRDGGAQRKHLAKFGGANHSSCPCSLGGRPSRR